MTDARSPVRALRAALFAAICVTLASVGHSSMSGHPIPFPTLAAAFGVTGAVGWLAGGRRRGTVPIGTGMLAVQGALHLLYADAHPRSPGHHAHPGSGMTMSHPGAGSHPAAPGSAAPLHDPTAAADVTALVAGPGLPVPGTVLHGALGMLLVHLVAALVCALWLARGEAAFFQLARTAAALAFAPLRPPPSALAPPPLPRPARAGTGARLPHFRGVVLAHSLSRRGPPARRPLTRATAPGVAV
ncbi:hypothetical protein [Streptomyces sp. NPDC050504]|uniref:hypothetical protein n=1 Tax=Streptomyces sp. NPDC050504 TaxID=3365618 RepID=UPI003788AA2C